MEPPEDHPQYPGRRTALLFAADCAEHVLPLFERQRPKDDRPRRAIDVARRYANGRATEEELRAAETAAERAFVNAHDQARYRRGREDEDVFRAAASSALAAFCAARMPRWNQEVAVLEVTEAAQGAVAHTVPPPAPEQLEGLRQAENVLEYLTSPDGLEAYGRKPDYEETLHAFVEAAKRIEAEVLGEPNPAAEAEAKWQTERLRAYLKGRA